MNRLPKNFSFVALAAVCLTGPVSGGSQELGLDKLPKYQAPIPYAGIRNWHITHNLGPTGARGWVYGDRGHSRESREILIKSVEPGSPADGVLQIYDLIVGAAVPPNTPSTEWQSTPELRPFDADARMSLARAMTWAESTKGQGKLRLLRHRDGKVEPVTIQLPVMGDYSATAPFDCPKSERIAQGAAEFLAERMPVEGFSKGVSEPLAAALLLAAGEDRYLDHVRRSAYQMSINNTISDAGHETWRWGNTNTFLAEYYLATGDKRVLPTIEEYCNVLADGQCNPGTWGHRAVPDFIPPGYGSVNSTGVVCFLSIVLGDQCGVNFNKESIRHSINFYGSYVGRGTIPYGDHPPYYDATGNGKNGGAALAFNLLGAESATQWFARLTSSTNLTSFENGHSGNYFNQTWSPLGASLAGKENYSNFWARFNSYRDLARRRDGSFMTQPWPHKREGDLGTGNYVHRGPMWSTGGFALSYLAGTERLAILGRTDSVFAVDAPPELKGALDLYHAKKFEASREKAKALAQSGLSERVRRLATQLAEAADRNLRSIDLTLASMNEALASGDFYKLKQQLQGIESIIDANDTRLRDFRAAIEDPENEQLLAEGRDFYASISGAKYTGSKGFQFVALTAKGDGRAWDRLLKLAKEGKGPYQQMARDYIRTHPTLVLGTSEAPLLPPPAKEMRHGSYPADKEAICWRYALSESKAGDDWKAPSYRDDSWTAVALPSKVVGGKGTSYLRGSFEVENPAEVKGLSVDYTAAGPFKLFLNGELVLDYTGGDSKRGKTTIPLKPITRELLKPGANLLAVEATVLNQSADFDLLLKASMEGSLR